MTDSGIEQFLIAEINKLSSRQKAVTHLVSLAGYAQALETLLEEVRDEMSVVYEEYKDLFEEPTDAQGNQSS